MAQVGARFPLMLYKGGTECIVYDEDEEKDARSHGFKMLGEGDAEHKPETKEDHASGEAQSGVRQEDGHSAESGSGVRGGGSAAGKPEDHKQEHKPAAPQGKK